MQSRSTIGRCGNRRRPSLRTPGRRCRSPRVVGRGADPPSSLERSRRSASCVAQYLEPRAHLSQENETAPYSHANRPPAPVLCWGIPQCDGEGSVGVGGDAVAEDSLRLGCDRIGDCSGKRVGHGVNYCALLEGRLLRRGRLRDAVEGSGNAFGDPSDGVDGGSGGRRRCCGGWQCLGWVLVPAPRDRVKTGVDDVMFTLPSCVRSTRLDRSVGAYLAPRSRSSCCCSA